MAVTILLSLAISSLKLSFNAIYHRLQCDVFGRNQITVVNFTVNFIVYGFAVKANHLLLLVKSGEGNCRERAVYFLFRFHPRETINPHLSNKIWGVINLRSHTLLFSRALQSSRTPARFGRINGNHISGRLKKFDLSPGTISCEST